MVITPEIWRNRRVLITGHTGFKGAWLSEWLLTLGAEVMGCALPPESVGEKPPLSTLLNHQHRVDHRVVDIRDLNALKPTIKSFRPEVIFHLAAQPLVRVSYAHPLQTFETNIMGTANLLESARSLASACTIIIVTTDKVYANQEWPLSYREADPLGGNDPYSASKSCAELVSHSYRKSYFGPQSHVRLATARAGNVIGAGDWALNRIVPDCIRAIQKSQPIELRNPSSTRPWQHVLEALSGYLCLAEQISIADQYPTQLCSAFNFGPSLQSNRTVKELAVEILKHAPGTWVDSPEKDAPHEASLLHLAHDKANHLLGWSPSWSFEETVAHTVSGYAHLTERTNQPAQAMDHVTTTIKSYSQAMAENRTPRTNLKPTFLENINETD